DEVRRNDGGLEEAERLSKPVTALCFLFNNRCIDDYSTPSSLELTDGCAIQTRSKVDICIKYGARMLSMKTAYAERVGVDAKIVELFANGDHVNDDDTPFSLKLKSRDVIEAEEDE
ncbi:Protein SMO-1, partial [Aphelenchoides avenae]